MPSCGKTTEISLTLQNSCKANSMQYKTIVATIDYYMQYMKHVKFIMYSSYNSLRTGILIYINGSINYPLDIYNYSRGEKNGPHTHTQTQKPLHVWEYSPSSIGSRIIPRSCRKQITMADTQSLITHGEGWLYDSEAESSQIILWSNILLQCALLRAF
jgi:hypothetical protein